MAEIPVPDPPPPERKTQIRSTRGCQPQGTFPHTRAGERCLVSRVPLGAVRRASNPTTPEAHLLVLAHLLVVADELQRIPLWVGEVQRADV